MNLQNLNLVELNAQEVQGIDGGLATPKYGYWELSWSGTDNELVYAAETIGNAGKMLVNGAAWIANQF